MSDKYEYFKSKSEEMEAVAQKNATTANDRAVIIADLRVENSALRKQLEEIEQRDPWWCACTMDGVDDRDSGITCDAHDKIGAAEDEAGVQMKRAEAAEARLSEIEMECNEAIVSALKIVDRREELVREILIFSKAYRAAQARIAELEKELLRHKPVDDRAFDLAGQVPDLQNRLTAQAAEIKDYREALEWIRDEGGPDFDSDDMSSCANDALARYPAPSSDPGSAKI